MTLNKMSNHSQRLIIGCSAAFFVVMIILLAHNPLMNIVCTLLLAVIVGASMWEYYNIGSAIGLRPLKKLGITGGVLYVLVTSLTIHTPKYQLDFLPNLILAISFLLFFARYFAKGENPFTNIAVSFFGLVYLAVPLSYLLSITFFPFNTPHLDGRWWMLYLLFVTKMTDTGAYFIGKRFGTKRLAPYISPGKTWEGAFGGLATALFTSIIFYLIDHFLFTTPALGITFSRSIWLGLLMGILAQLGDLAESLLKRDCGVKDSNQLPGLGGILDVVDSLVFTAPLLYILLEMEAP